MEVATTFWPMFKNWPSAVARNSNQFVRPGPCWVHHCSHLGEGGVGIVARCGQDVCLLRSGYCPSFVSTV